MVMGVMVTAPTLLLGWCMVLLVLSVLICWLLVHVDIGCDGLVLVLFDEMIVKINLLY